MNWFFEADPRDPGSPFVVLMITAVAVTILNFRSIVRWLRAPEVQGMAILFGIMMVSLSLGAAIIKLAILPVYDWAMRIGWAQSVWPSVTGWILVAILGFCVAVVVVCELISRYHKSTAIARQISRPS